MRQEASILHLDLDAFFAAVEQRDKPSLRGKPVVVGGLGGRGVVSTASYEARRFGVHSAMPMHEAKRLCPHAAFLSGRFGAYRVASRQVMTILRAVSGLIEPLSLDEAFVDLMAGPPRSFAADDLLDLAERIRRDVLEATGGLTASVGMGTSKFMAKLASEQAKPDGVTLVRPGTEADTIRLLPVRVIPGVGPMTASRLDRLGIATVDDLRRALPSELRREVGAAQASWLVDIAYAHDDRPVSADREVKSISVEDTFAADRSSVADLVPHGARMAEAVAARLRRTGLFARTITVKLKQADFSIHTRSRTLLGAVDDTAVITEVALSLLAEQAHIVREGVRLLGVGVSGFTSVAQEALFEVSQSGADDTRVDRGDVPAARARVPAVEWWPGEDVTHDLHGPGWVWGSGLGRVTVRFETAATGPGPVRTFAVTDPALHATPVVPPEDAASGPGWADGEELE